MQIGVLIFVSGIPRIDLRKWKEETNLRPQQLNSLDIHPLLKDLLQQEDISFASEEPSRPHFPSDDQDFQADDLEFETEDQDEINDFIEKPSIGLEWNVQYNDELPIQLSPDLYYNLNWALAEDRQELTFEE